MSNKKVKIIIGEETRRVLLRSISDKDKEIALQEAQIIIEKIICIKDKRSTRSITGLVMGYVQSGKTYSISLLIALAKDNGIPMIILMSGTQLKLYYQSLERLRSDFKVFNRDKRDFYLYCKSDLSNPLVSSIEKKISTISKNQYESIVFSIMKNVNDLSKVISIIGDLQDRNIPCLIIDDEADQASLNNRVNYVSNDPSKTYKNITELRKQFKRHAYVQYTATPQAPLLINMIDLLSPQFGVVLTPGSGYIGGKEIFYLNSPFVKIIPDEDIQELNEVENEDIPLSLKMAMASFFIGVSIGIINKEHETNDKNRSMMINPCHKKDGHTIYVQWVNDQILEWMQYVKYSEKNPKYAEMRSVFLDAYNDLGKTSNGSLVSFDKIWRKLQEAFDRTETIECNTKRSNQVPDIPWKNNYSYILVGGAAMSRGFTVEGLTVAYVPRNLGGGFCDTIQQRARWFGYKEEYLGLCRIYLPESIKYKKYKSQSAFMAYVEHEEDLRRLMKKYGNNLLHYKKIFFLDPDLKPTRDAVLDTESLRISSSGWIKTEIPIGEEEFNWKLVNTFLKKYKKKIHPRYPQHSMTDLISVQTVIKDLLIPFRHIDEKDILHFTALLHKLEFYLGQTKEESYCAVFIMGASDKVRRERTLNNYGRIDIMQGESTKYKNDKTTYPGDKKIYDNENLTIQIHLIDLKDDSSKKVVALAVHMPSKYNIPYSYIQTKEPKKRIIRKGGVLV